MQNSVMQNFITHTRSGRTATVSVWLMVVVLAFLLCGCGLASFGYRNGETLSYWWLNGYVDFDAEQTPQVKQHIRELFGWHRKTQLPVYMKNLAAAQKRLQHDGSQAEVLATEVQANYADLKKQVFQLIDTSLPALADLALSLRPEQIAHIEKKFLSNNDKYRKDFLQGDLE